MEKIKHVLEELLMLGGFFLEAFLFLFRFRSRIFMRLILAYPT